MVVLPNLVDGRYRCLLGDFQSIERNIFIPTTNISISLDYEYLSIVFSCNSDLLMTATAQHVTRFKFANYVLIKEGLGFFDKLT